MTIKVKISNEEGPEGTVSSNRVRVRMFRTSPNGERYEDSGNPPVDLAPGESTEKWIHGSAMVEVTEIVSG